MGKLFGTDGVRGLANSVLTPELALNLGRAGAYVLTKSAISKEAPKILVGVDSRRSGDMLAAALTAGLCSVGAEVYHAGVIPTPGVAYLVRHYGFDAGVMISASHNPMADNGIKFFCHTGYKLPDAREDEIEAYMEKLEDLPRPIGKGVGAVQSSPKALEDYRDYLLSTVRGLRLRGLKIALDCANGATSKVAPLVFRELGATVHCIHNGPDGININENCGSTHMESLSRYVVNNEMDLGLAFDGDGDRILAVDGEGQLVDGDEILAICGYDLKQQEELPGNAIVATTMSNQGLEVFCREQGITLYRTDVGDRYVIEKMLSANVYLGGEQSGHIIFKGVSTTGDGILTGLKLVEVVARRRRPLAELRTIMEQFPQVLVNVTIADDKKREWDKYNEITSLISEMEAGLAGDGRILVRPSGTEPLVRVMIEGRNLDDITEMANRLAGVIEGTLG